MSHIISHLSPIRITVRDVNEVAMGQLESLVEADFIPRWNGVGTWRILCSMKSSVAQHFKSGAGITVALPDGRRFTGQTTKIIKRKTREVPNGLIEVSGVEDTAILGFRLVFPTPSQPANLQTATATYNASGPAETVAKNIVRSNLGSSAIAARKDSKVTVALDAARGGTVNVSARFDNMLDQVQRILTPKGLGFSLRWDDTKYLFDVYETRDLTGSVKFSENLGNLEGWEYSLAAPQLTQALVAGQGEGTARNIRIYDDPINNPAIWGWLIEQFIDRRDTNATLDLDQAAVEAFEAGGGEQFSLVISPTDSVDVRFGRDYYLGDQISVKIDGSEYNDTVTSAAYEIRAGSIRIKPTIGGAESVHGRMLDIYRVVKLIATRVGLLEKRF